LALANLKKITVNGYASSLRRYEKYCLRSCYEDPFDKAVVEEYVMSMWRKGVLKQTPNTFRSAIRKFCILEDRPDPITPKLNLMINAFGTDYPDLEIRYIPPGDLDLLKELARTSKRPDWEECIELLDFSILQNVRSSTLLKIKFNDVFVESGGIHLAFVKDHVGPVNTILHPGVEPILEKRSAGKRPNDLIAGIWTKKELNAVLAEMCSKAGIAAHTWHDARHTSTQFMNDLNYPGLIMQALGTWKVSHSMKHYIRDRKGCVFDKETIAEHKRYVAILSERLQKNKGKMVWLQAPGPVKPRRQGAKLSKVQ
jgi:hypothetical protein